MRKRIFVVLVAGIAVCVLVLVARYWVNTQPIGVVTAPVSADTLRSWNLPGKNRAIIAYIEREGPQLAPRYDQVVCTEFLIKVIDPFTSLDNGDKKSIRIITSEDLDSLVSAEAPLIKGVQTALVQSGKGLTVASANVVPGDLVQFWNVHNGRVYGHCGVVLKAVPGEELTLYSSHPMTGGFGRQVFQWPVKTFFVRLL